MTAEKREQVLREAITVAEDALWSSRDALEEVGSKVALSVSKKCDNALSVINVARLAIHEETNIKDHKMTFNPPSGNPNLPRGINYRGLLDAISSRPDLFPPDSPEVTELRKTVESGQDYEYPG